MMNNMKKILFIILLALTISGCNYLGRGNEFVVTQVSESSTYSSYPYYVRIRNCHSFNNKEFYIYTSSKYFVGDTLTLIKK